MENPRAVDLVTRSCLFVVLRVVEVYTLWLLSVKRQTAPLSLAAVKETRECVICNMQRFEGNAVMEQQL